MPVQTGTVSFQQPSPNQIVGRRMQITIQLSANFGPTPSVSALFIFGSQAAGIGLSRSGLLWVFDGIVPAFIPAGALFTIRATAHGQIGTFLTVDGSGSVNAVLEFVVPSVSMSPFQSPVVVSQPPYVFPLYGSASEGFGPPYGVSQVQYQVGNGPLQNAEPAIPGIWTPWNAPNVVVPSTDDTVITVRATDPYGGATTAQRPLALLQFPMPASVDPNAKKTAAGVPTTSSITSWTRLEPQCANADVGTSSGARLFDPLWLMARQWQMGEFQGEDTGTPVQARVRATTAALTRCFLGELTATTAAPAYDPARAPLETIVERRRMRAAGVTDSRMLTLSIEAGLHFLRMLELNTTTKKYRPAFLTTYALQQQGAPPETLDDAAARLMQTMVGRAPDARRLAAALRHPGSPQIVFDSALKIAAADVAAVQQVADAWLAWYDGLFAEPAGPADNAWTPSRLEYAVSVSTRLSPQTQDAVTLSASEFDGGRLDWSSFDVNPIFALDTTGDASFAPLNEITVPTPVSVPGAPAARFWEMEDAKIAYGLLAAGPTDLAHLMTIEYASSYGNDWYVVPLTTPIGTVTRVDSLVVTDTFGVRNLLRPIGDSALPNPYFSMWQQSTARAAGEVIAAPVANRFFLPPTIGRSIDGALLEDVLFMRDEMANLAWGIERSIEDAVERTLSLANASNGGADGSPETSAPGAAPHYLLATTVPDNWIPLMPVQLDAQGTLRLKRGAVLQPDGTNETHPSRSEVLGELGSALLYDEEVPREGVRVTRRRRMTRWIDGSAWVWTAFRNEVGTGEGSAGLRFDRLEDS